MSVYLQVFIDNIDTGTDDPQETVWEQTLLERVLRDTLITTGYGDAEITIEVIS